MLPHICRENIFYVFLDNRYHLLEKKLQTLHHLWFSTVDDGGFSEWGSWSQCSKTCGDGRRSRRRSCTNPPPSPGGKDCSDLGPDTQYEDCNDGSCPGKRIKIFQSKSHFLSWEIHWKKVTFIKDENIKLKNCARLQAVYQTIKFSVKDYRP